MSILSSIGFTEYDPITQIALPEGAKARLGKGEVKEITFSPNGNFLAIGSSIGIWIYDVKIQKEVSLLTDHSWGGVECVTFSPDGNTLASGTWDGTVQLWNVLTGKYIATPKHKENAATSSVAFSPDGNTLISGYRYAYNPDRKRYEMTLGFWNVATANYKGTFKGKTPNISSVAFSPDGSTVASGSKDTTIRLWDVTTRQQLAVLKEHTGGINGLEFSPDGSILASGGGYKDNTIRFWDSTYRNTPKDSHRTY